MEGKAITPKGSVGMRIAMIGQKRLGFREGGVEVVV